MIHYILQILAFQLLFLLVYDLFLKKETFFNCNRVYLLTTPILSFILPFIQINAIQERVPREYLLELPSLLITNEILLPEIVIASSPSFYSLFMQTAVWQYLWYLGAVISLSLFVYKIFTIIKLKQTGVKTKTQHFNLVVLPNTQTAFSFFNTIYLGAEISEAKKSHILLHERVHIREYHSLDLIFFELLRIAMWFNPLVYIYQKRIAMLQEYIADSKAIAEVDKKEYYQDLLSQIFQTEKISFINTFFNHSFIKNRIVMLSKSKSKKIFQLKYLVLVPVIGAMLIYSSCSQENSAESEVKSKSEFTIKANDLLAKIKSDGEYSDENRKLFRQLMTQVDTQNDITPEEKKAFNALLAKISKIKESDHRKKGEIPFASIEKVPVYPGCDDQSPQELKKCFMTNIKQFVAAEFNMNLAKDLGFSGKQRVYVRFKIDNTGDITNVQSRGPHPSLEEEAKRVISLLPKMTPGQENGADKSVLFSLPILLDIKE